MNPHRRAHISRWFGNGIVRANERMQLTWLLGAPSRPASVHRRAIGRLGLGSPATQLMRAVRLAKPILLSPLRTWLAGLTARIRG